VGGPGGHLLIGRWTALWWHRDFGDQLVAGEHGFVITRAERVGSDGARTFRADHRHARAERGEYRRQVHVRVGMSHRATDGRDGAHAHARKRAQRARQHRPAALHVGVVLERRQAREAADHELARRVHPHLGVRRLDVLKADEAGRREHARLHHQHDRGAATDRPDARVFGVEQADGLFHRIGNEELERHHGLVLCESRVGRFSPGQQSAA
jgi:hypothetical protein